MEAQGRIIVAGAGPVGALSALYAARSGYDVELRREEAKVALAEQSLVDNVLGNQPKRVAKPAEEYGGSSSIPIPRMGAVREVSFEFLIGADGTCSSVRQAMRAKRGVDFSQVYCNALWCDLIFPADKNGDYRMNSECLHVWPADENISIAQPDFVSTNTGTMSSLMSTSHSTMILRRMVCATESVRFYEEHSSEFAAWFKKEFAGITPDLLSPQELTKQFIAHQKISLKSIKLSKLGYKDNAALLGDSSHTMTPFHAMGMITGLEDVRVFFQEFRDPAAAHLKTRPGSNTITPFCPNGTIAAYTEHRLPDVHTMVDLAHEHYNKLRHGVRSPFSRARKVFDAALGRYISALDWTTMYARIQFGSDRFSDVVRKEKQQEVIVGISIYTAVVFATSALAAALRTFIISPNMTLN